MSDFWEDEYDDDNISFDEEEVQVDMVEIDRLAKRKLLFHFSCTINSFDRSALLVEAEILLAKSDYHAALVCATASGPSPSASAITVIALYQLGDKSAAISLVERQEKTIVRATCVSNFLKQKFTSTVEVLRFMPELLAMLAKK